MKRIPKLIPQRHGAFFVYYLGYLLLSGILLTSSVLCIHLIIKTEQQGQANQQLLRSLVRLEDTLRQDVAEYDSSKLLSNKWVFTDQNLTIQWVIDQHTLERKILDDRQLISMDSFVFPQQTSLQFVDDSHQVRLVITEPIQSLKGKKSAVNSGLTKSIEIRLLTTGDH